MKAFEKARRVWCGSADGVNTYADFTDSFERGDRIRVSCDGNYSLYINGSFVDCGQYPGYEDMQFFDELDISEFVVPGKNTLKLIAHHPGADSSTYRNKPAYVIYEVSSGGEVVCASGESTLTRPDPNYEHGEQVGRVSGQLGFTFAYDACAPESAYAPASEADGSYDFLPRPIEKLTILPPAAAKLINQGVFADRLKSGTPAQRMQNALLGDAYLCGGTALPSEDVIALKSDGSGLTDGIYAIIDLGAESAGFLSLDIELDYDADIFIGWGEHLSDLRVRTSIGGRNFAARYRAKKGRSHFENLLLRCGLRYVQLHIYADSCRLHYAGIRPTVYPLPKAAPCPVDDRLHRKIYEVCTKTLELCMHEHYEDCPWREQALYTMDSRNQMLCGYHVFGETRFAKASLALIAHSQREDGMLELCSPARVSITIPSFSAIFLVQLFEYLEHSGDEAFVREMLTTAKRIAGSFASRLESGLIKCFAEPKYWNFYEWQDGLSESRSGGELSFDAPLSAFVSMGLKSLAKICERLGDADAERYDSLHREMNLAAQSFWDEERGCYASYIKNGARSHYCELTNSLLVCAGAVPEDRLQRVLDSLKSGGLIPVTLSHSIFKFDALLTDSSNRDFVMNDIAEKWGYMLERGATSFWETIDGESAFANAGSLCHGWSAVPAYIYFKTARL